MTERNPLLAQLDWTRRRDDIIKSMKEYKRPATTGTKYFISVQRAILSTKGNPKFC